MVESESESGPDNMGDNMSEDGDKPASDKSLDEQTDSDSESLLEQQAAELLQEFNEIEDRYRQYTSARSDVGTLDDMEVAPTVTLHANMLSGETASIEVVDIETVRMIKDQLKTKIELAPTSQTILICDNQVLRDNQFVAQFPCHKVTIVVASAKS